MAMQKIEFLKSWNQLYLDEDSMTSQMVSCSGPVVDMSYVDSHYGSKQTPRHRDDWFEAFVWEELISKK